MPRRCLRCSRFPEREDDHFCPYHAAMIPPRRCGWGGAPDDPAPCREMTRPGRYLCDRHGRIIRGSEPSPKARQRKIKVGTGARSNPTDCKQGHEFTEANTYVDPRGFRVCKICRAEQSRALRARRKAARERQREETCRRGHSRAEHTVIHGGQKRCLACRDEAQARRKDAAQRAAGAPKA